MSIICRTIFVYVVHIQIIVHVLDTCMLFAKMLYLVLHICSKSTTYAWAYPGMLPVDMHRDPESSIHRTPTMEPWKLIKCTAI